LHEAASGLCPLVVCVARQRKWFRSEGTLPAPPAEAYAPAVGQASAAQE